ncbi:MAG TPA: carbamoyltransferase C-terminal domain-containing protein [Ktedonosporobacter sp.]|jgi:carbamoyltransferase|nr:carbamoyltransferase C-terminal domain-containing protein [Ktedonosporobacter sp.]
MIILGINGKLDGHDPSAALLREGQLLAAAEEERFYRIKHAPGRFPYHATAWCLTQAGISVDEIDAIVFGWEPTRQPDAPEPTDTDALRDLILPPVLFPRTRSVPVHRVPHHLAHAAYAFYSSPFNEAAALIVDGSGERESISVFRCNTTGLELVWSLPFVNSPGFFYEALTRFVGMTLFDEGKTMGLAAYGQERYTFPSLLEHPPLSPAADPDAEHYRAILKAWRQILEKHTNTSPNPRLPRFSMEEGRADAKAVGYPQIYRDIALAGQRRLEEDLLTLAQRALHDTGYSNLVLAGGVALNCVANGKLAQTLGASIGFHVPPASGDAGISLGAALYGARQYGDQVRLTNAHVFSGPRFSQEHIVNLLQAWGIRFEILEDPVPALVDELAHGKIVGFFQGPAEIGPRALGGRSLLADPSQPNMLTRVNQLKKREMWRPLAPSLPFDEVHAVFKHDVSSPFMLISYPVLDQARNTIPAAVHVDNSTRPQIVTPDLHESFYRLVSGFAQCTGIPALLNTSFNVGEPMVLTPAQAIRTFSTSPMDLLAIEGIMLRKPQ